MKDPFQPVPKTFVLLHGSWHAAWAWVPVARRLRDAGHHVYAPTLAGHGLPIPPQHLSFATIVQEVIDFLEVHDLWAVQLVGWSFGGAILQQVAQRVPQRLGRLIFWNAIVLADGENILDFASAADPALTAGLTSLRDPQTNAVQLPRDAFEHAFMPDGDATLVDATYPRLCPEPWDPMSERPNLSLFYAHVAAQADPLQQRLIPPLPMTYILGSEDRGFGSALWASQRARLGPTCVGITLPVGAHEALLTQPESLADALLEASGAGHRPLSHAATATARLREQGSHHRRAQQRRRQEEGKGLRTSERASALDTAVSETAVTASTESTDPALLATASTSTTPTTGSGSGSQGRQWANESGGE